jgi:hypothetical protein
MTEIGYRVWQSARCAHFQIAADGLTYRGEQNHLSTWPAEDAGTNAVWLALAGREDLANLRTRGFA